MDSAWHAPRRVETTPTLESSAIGDDQKESREYVRFHEWWWAQYFNQSTKSFRPFLRTTEKQRANYTQSSTIPFNFLLLCNGSSNGWDFIMRKRFCPPQKDGLVWLLFCCLWNECVLIIILWGIEALKG